MPFTDTRLRYRVTRIVVTLVFCSLLLFIAYVRSSLFDRYIRSFRDYRYVTFTTVVEFDDLIAVDV